MDYRSSSGPIDTIEFEILFLAIKVGAGAGYRSRASVGRYVLRRSAPRGIDVSTRSVFCSLVLHDREYDLLGIVG